MCDGSLPGVPDLRNRFIVGAGSTLSAYTPDGVGGIAAGYFPVGQIGGEQMHLLTIAEMPNHTHSTTVTSVGEAGSGQFTDGGQGGGATLKTASAGGGSAHNIMPPYYSLSYIIKL